MSSSTDSGDADVPAGSAPGLSAAAADRSVVRQQHERRLLERQEALLPATYDTWTMSVQRELVRGMTVEVDYNGSKGSNLQANLLNLNQVPLSVVNDLIARFGAAAPWRC